MSPWLAAALVAFLLKTRADRHYRRLGIAKGESMIWFWIGSHDDSMKIIPR